LPYYSTQATLKLVQNLSTYDLKYALESHNDEVYTQESFKAYLKLLASLANIVQDISDKETLEREVEKQFPDLPQEDVKEYSMMFLNGLKSERVLGSP
jgi:hypothetical protein